MPVELIGQILLRQTSLAESELAEALAEQETGGRRRRIGRILLSRKCITSAELARALAEQWSLPYLEIIDTAAIDRELVQQLPLEFLKNQCALPLVDTSGNGGEIIIALSDPLNTKAFDTIAGTLRRTCNKAVCTPEVIEEAVSRCFYHTASDAGGMRAEAEEADVRRSDVRDSETEDLLKISGTAPIVKLINSFFFQAAQSGASDIHIEPYEHEIRVRFRIDGILHNSQTLAREHAAALVSRLKVMANLNIAERRLPQDGRCKIKIGENEIDVRVSTVPTSGGERVVLRLLDKSAAAFGLNRLGFSPDIAARFSRFVHKPHGIILLTGPTGSGKTTTLYSALTEINTEEVNILTVEDPIEYQLPGVGQMQIRPRINLTFANCLRHILRQDPDVIMVGEIRDAETAEIAIQAALTGHLVFSTLHTNDAATAVTRLLDMGIEPYLVASSVNAIMAQRLVRVICTECKTPRPATADERAAVGKDVETLFYGAGCPACLNTGYKGRTVIAELLAIDDRIRDMIMQRTGAATIRRTAVERGMRTLRDDGMAKVINGQTTLEEVVRATQEDVPEQK